MKEQGERIGEGNTQVTLVSLTKSSGLAQF